VHPEIIVMGTSLGGLRALQIVLGGFDAQLPVPIVLVMHRGKAARDSLAPLIQQRTVLNVREPEDKQSLNPANVYIAPADYHLLIERGHCALSLDPPVNFARPSVDVLFESAADAYGAATICVVLTGNNNDGARGAARIKAAGGTVIVQDPGECESGNMPNSTLQLTEVDAVLKLSEMASFLMERCAPAQEQQNGSR
jgi:two-component system, chemotaxis family, protein-glutamate methylesterase/glutaminase